MKLSDDIPSYNPSDSDFLWFISFVSLSVIQKLGVYMMYANTKYAIPDFSSKDNICNP